MRLSGVIIDTLIVINGASIGKPFLAFVHVDGWGKSQRMMKLKCSPEVEEMHSVVGYTVSVWQTPL